MLIADRDDADELTEEMEAELEAAAAEIERGEWVDGDALIREMQERARRA